MLLQGHVINISAILMGCENLLCSHSIFSQGWHLPLCCQVINKSWCDLKFMKCSYT